MYNHLLCWISFKDIDIFTLDMMKSEKWCFLFQGLVTVNEDWQAFQGFDYKWLKFNYQQPFFDSLFSKTVMYFWHNSFILKQLIDVHAKKLLRYIFYI